MFKVLTLFRKCIGIRLHTHRTADKYHQNLRSVGLPQECLQHGPLRQRPISGFPNDHTETRVSRIGFTKRTARKEQIKFKLHCCCCWTPWIRRADVDDLQLMKYVAETSHLFRLVSIQIVIQKRLGTILLAGLLLCLELSRVFAWFSLSNNIHIPACIVFIGRVWWVAWRCMTGCAANSRRNLDHGLCRRFEQIIVLIGQRALQMARFH